MFAYYSCVMQNIISSHQLQAPDHDHAYSRIRKIGKIGRAICTFLLLVVALSILACGGALLLDPEALGKILHIENKMQIFFLTVTVPSDSDIPGFLQWSATVAGVLAFGVHLALIWFMRSIFGTFVTGEVFTARCANRIKWLGGIMVGGFFLDLSVEFVLLPGLFLLALGMVMEIASTIKQENDLTV
jgi:hypothetical protein